MFGYYFLKIPNKYIVRNLVLLGGLWLLWIVIHLPFVGDFAWGRALISIITFFAFIPIVVIPWRFLSGEWLMPRLLRWVRLIVILQASLGIVQALYGFLQTRSFDLGNGDYVEGTIHPALATESSFSNPMFAVNMTVLILFMLPSLLTQRKYLFVILFGLVVLILASVVHVLFFLGVATALVLLLYAPTLLSRRSGWLFIGLAIIAMVFALNLLSSNFSNVQRVFGLAAEALTPAGSCLK